MWFGVKTLYSFKQSDKDLPDRIYEERIVLFNADSFDEAIRFAEEEASSFVARDQRYEFLNYADAYMMPEASPSAGTEIYSKMFRSELNEKDYIDLFYDRGKSREMRGGINIDWIGT